MTPTRKRIAVLGLGGTIAMQATANGGATPSLSAADLLDAVPGLGRLDVGLDVEDVRRLPGASLGFADVEAVAAIVRARCAAGADGVVVIQGTDTIEESAVTPPRACSTCATPVPSRWW